MKDLGCDLEPNFVCSPSRRAGIRLRLRMTTSQTQGLFLIRISRIPAGNPRYFRCVDGLSKARAVAKGTTADGSDEMRPWPFVSWVYVAVGHSVGGGALPVGR